MTNWWLDEVAHAGHEHLDAAYVAGYEAKAQYDPTADLAALARHGFCATSAIVDLGAGTGRFSVQAAAICAHVTAVDVSPAMIDVIRRRTADLDNVTVVQGGFLSYDHARPPAEFVFSRNALHQIPDFWKGVALARIAAMMTPGGVFRLLDLVFDFEPSEAETWVPAWMAGGIEDPAKGWTPAELGEHVRLEYSTYSWLFEPMLERVGFEILDKEYVRNAYGAYTLRKH